MNKIASGKALFRTLVVGSALALASSAFAQKVEITVAVFPNIDDSIKAQLPGFNKLYPDIVVKLATLPYSDHHNALVTALTTGQGLPDVAAIEVGFIGRFAEGKGFEDLNKAPYNAASLKKLYVPFTIAQATSSDGRFVGLPVDIGPGTFYYRKDILDKAKINPASMMTWDGYIEAGKKIKAMDPKVFLIADAGDVARIVYQALVKPGEGYFFDKDGKILVESQRFVRGFELAKKIRDAKLDARIGAWSNEWFDGFKKGTLATQFSGAWLEGHIKNNAPNTAGLWRVQQLPEKMYGSWGGSFYGITSGSKNKDAAWKLVKYLSNNKDAQLAGFRAIGAFPSLKSAQSDPAFSQGVDFLGGQKARLLWKTAAARVPAVDTNRFDSIAQEIVNAEMAKVLDEGMDIRAALAEAKKLIEQKMR